MEEESQKSKNEDITINFLGDSITYGSKLKKDLSERFTTLLESKLKIKSLNFGVSGSRIAKIPSCDIECFLDRFEKLSKNANFTFIFGGVNDYKNGTVLGDKSSDNVETFYGALKFLISKLLSIWNNTQLCFILPLPARRKSPLNLGLDSYINPIKELCLENKIDFLDLSKEFGDKKLFADGLHPNQKGHKLLAEELEKYILKKGIVNS